MSVINIHNRKRGTVAKQIITSRKLPTKDVFTKKSDILKFINSSQIRVVLLKQTLIKIKILFIKNEVMSRSSLLRDLCLSLIERVSI